MQRIAVDGIELAYVDEGSGPETVVISHSFLVDHRHFDAQIESLSRTHRVVAFDHRDHGASDRVGDDYDIHDLVKDADGVIRALDLAPCHFVGLSTGGFVGMRMALADPEHFRSLTLMDTSAGSESGVTGFKNRILLLLLRTIGLRPLLGTAMKTMFGPVFMKDPDRGDERELWRARMADNDPKALIRFGKAILGRDDVLDRMGEIRIPTLVVAGADDRAVPVKHARELAEAIPGAELSLVPDAGHLCTIEQPDAVGDLLGSFIERHSG